MSPQITLPRMRLLRSSFRQKRFRSSQAPAQQPPKQSARIGRMLDRMPKFLRPYTNGIRNAPGTHITSFLILHELTAIVPLVVLGMGFHYSGWLPGNIDEEKVLAYMRKFGGYFSRKGWFGVSTSVSTDVNAQKEVGEFEGEKRHEAHKVMTHDVEDRIVGEQRYGQGTRVVLEVATAYAITKMLLPVRVVGSVWATPWFAKRVLGAFKRFKR